MRIKGMSWKRLAYTGFALLALLLCWEGNRTNGLLYTAAAASGAPNEAAIPQESIRLRILANSDAPLDQWIKGKVRDRIVAEMEGWALQPQTIEEARTMIRTRLPELEALVGGTLQDYGFDYAYKVELGIVPFPTKLYGNRIYPAGDYEALRVSIGKAEGQNWWCVLFPPLCFVDSEMVAKKNTAYAEAAPADAKAAGEPGKAASGDKAAGDGKAAAAGKPAAQTTAKAAQAAPAEQTHEAAPTNGAPQPEIRFFLWDLVKQVFSFLA